MAVILSGLLTVIKGAGAFLCSSTSLLASALDSMMDVGLSSMNLFSAWRSSKPPDDDHAYGHEKIESLASYTQGLVFVGLSAWLFLSSIFKLTYHGEVSREGFGILVVVLALGLNLVITWNMSQSEKKTGSLILKTEKAHYSMDILSHLLILAAFFLVRWTHGAFWDRWTGFILASYIMYLAVKLILQAGNELVDRSLPSGILRELDLMIRGHHAQILDYHEMRTRKVGEKYFIDFHLVLKSDQSFEQVHEITESLVEKIKLRFKNADVTIHEDPEEGR